MARRSRSVGRCKLLRPPRFFTPISVSAKMALRSGRPCSIIYTKNQKEAIGSLDRTLQIITYEMSGVCRNADKSKIYPSGAKS